MKRFVLSLLILVSFSSVFSQRLFFIYLQSENDQPFFLKMNDKIHSSSAAGYLLLSRMRDSSYTFSIGFPQNKFPEQRFAVDIKGKDRGYLLKNFGEKGWGLFDLQTLAIQMALPDKSGAIKTELRDDISPFTEILAKAANDPSLKERPVIVKMEEKPVVVEPAVLKEVVKPSGEPVITKQDSQAVAKQDKEPEGQKQEPLIIKQEVPPGKDKSDSGLTKDEVVKQEQPAITNPVQQPDSIKSDQSLVVKEDPAQKKEEAKSMAEAEYKTSVVIKKSESSTTEGLGLVFIDEFADGKRDTIRILIPNSRKSSVETKEQPKQEKKFLDISISDTVKQTEIETKTVKAQDTPQKGITNTNCKALATESDISKLQKKMIGEKKDDDMIAEARKIFKSKCFTSEQLKHLSALFMNDAGRYKFFDAAYVYVADIENFSSLSAELKDDYYINRFKAMLR